MRINDLALTWREASMNGIVTTDLIRAVDLSYGVILAYEDPDRFRAWCEARKAEGYELLIVCCWLGNATPLGAEEALRIAREVGLLTAAYGAVHDGRPGAEHVRRMIEGAGREWPKLEFAAVDCEEIRDVALQPETIGDALEAIDVTGQLGIIYTRESYWRDVQGDIRRFGAYALWEAWYGVKPELEGTGGFGGWHYGEGKGLQYQGTTDLDGVAVDFSVFSREWLESLTQKGGNMPKLTDQVRNALDVLRGFSHTQQWGNLWELQRQLEALEHQAPADRLASAVQQLQDASRVLDKAFGIE